MAKRPDLDSKLLPNRNHHDQHFDLCDLDANDLRIILKGLDHVANLDTNDDNQINVARWLTNKITAHQVQYGLDLDQPATNNE